MNRLQIFLSVAVLSSGCRGPVCPDGFVLDSAGGCSAIDGGQPEDAGTSSDASARGDGSDDGAAVGDAGSVEDGGSDSGLACAPAAEACNGLDDDCDGRADESLGSVGAAVTVTSGDLRSPQIVALPTGFGVVYRDGDLAWRTVSVSGSPTSSPVDLGTDTSGSQMGISARFDGTNVVVAYSNSTGYRVVAFAPGDGGRAWGPFILPVPSGRNANYRVSVVDASDGRATVFGSYHTATSTSVRRYRLNTSGAIPVVIHEADVRTDLASANAWSAIDVGASDVVAFRTVTDDIALVSGGTGDDTTGFGAPFTVRTALEEPNVLGVALAVRTSSLPVGASNPIGVAWHRSLGAGFVQVTAFAATAVGTPTTLPGSNGAFDWEGLGPRTVEIIAASAASTSAVGGHWYVAAMDDDPSSTALSVGFLRAWEIVGDAEVMRTLPVPSEASAPRFDISAAASGTTIAVAEEDETHSVVMRLIGCH